MGERALMEKQITFWKAKWALGGQVGDMIVYAQVCLGVVPTSVSKMRAALGKIDDS